MMETVYLALVSCSVFIIRELSIEILADTEDTSLLPCSLWILHFAFLCYSRPTCRGGTTHSGPGTPPLGINKEMSPITCIRLQNHRSSFRHSAQPPSLISSFCINGWIWKRLHCVEPRYRKTKTRGLSICCFWLSNFWDECKPWRNEMKLDVNSTWHRAFCIKIWLDVYSSYWAIYHVLLRVPSVVWRFCCEEENL